MDKEDPEQLFEIFEDNSWHNKDDIIRDITDKLREFGYSTVDDSEYASDNEYYINFVCEHGIVHGHVWIYEDEDEGYRFDISDCDTNDNLNECPMCKKVKTVKICRHETIDKNDKIILDKKTIDDNDKIILDKKTIEEIIKLIESEEYYIVDDGIIIGDEEGIILTLRDILKGKNRNYRAK